VTGQCYKLSQEKNWQKLANIFTKKWPTILIDGVAVHQGKK
jgi:hypothetical protein